MVGSSSQQEWRQGWTMLAASMLGISLQNSAVYSLGVFMLPLEKEFAWSRAEMSAALSLFALLIIPFGPFVGSLIDTKGARALALPGIALFSVSFAAMSMNSGSLLVWYGLWVVLGFAALLTKTTVWTTAVSSVFARNRGLALAITLCGTGIASSGAPILSHWLIELGGWRFAFVWLGLGWGALAFPMAWLFFYDARDRRRLKPQMNVASKDSDPARLGGLSLREALRSRPFRTIILSTFMLNVIMAGLIIHLNPILVDQGLTATAAASVLGGYGVAAAFGKLSSGWVLDRIHGRFVAPVILGLPAAACLILTQPLTLSMALTATVLIGFASGAELQTLTYLVTRYVGLKQLGKIYGLFASVVGSCLAIGPVLTGLAFDHLGTYRPIMFALVPVTLICALLTASLGPYPELPGQQPGEGSF